MACSGLATRRMGRRLRLASPTNVAVTADAATTPAMSRVVVPGARGLRGGWGDAQKLSLQAPIIVKYRDEKTDLATTLESWLR